jgi:methylated-DNA-[protein]-cysteine S-methyltransferase
VAESLAWGLVESAWGFVAVVGDRDALDYVGYPLATSDEAIILAQRAVGRLGRFDPHAVAWAENSITDYFLGRPIDLRLLPIRLAGSAFQLRVWNVCRSIEYGKTLTYGEVAGLAGYRGAARAAGSALAANPAGLLVPCHRIVAANGIGGYGNAIEHKIALLELERASPIGNKPK